MGCIAAFVALISPRLALFLTWLLSDRLAIAFEHWYWPVLGWLLLPWTTLVYTFAYAPERGVTGVGWVLVVIAVLADLGAIGSGDRSRRRRDDR